MFRHWLTLEYALQNIRYRIAVNAYILRLGLSLNHALAMTDKRKRKAGEKPQHVAFILPCKATPIYGYHVGHRPYLKIYVVEPRSKKRMSELLRSGAVMGTKFDVYEDHIPFHLQFMLDANLFGCGWVEVSLESKFRTPLPGQSVGSSFPCALLMRVLTAFLLRCP